MSLDATASTPAATDTAAPNEASEASAREALAGALASEAEASEETPEVDAEDAKKAKQAERLARAEAAETTLRAKREAKKEAAWRQDAARERAAIEAERKELAAAKTQQAEINEMIRKGGPSALKALGVDYAELTQQYLEAQGPDAALNATRKELAALSAKLEAKEQAEREWHEQRQRSEREQSAKAQREQGLQYALGELDKVAEQYPNVYTLPEPLLANWLEQGTRILHKRLGRIPTVQDLFTALEVDAQEYHGHIESRRAQLARRSLPSEGDTNTQDSGRTANRPKTRTLSNAESSQVSTDVDESEEKQLARLKRTLREAMSKE